MKKRNIIKLLAASSLSISIMLSAQALAFADEEIIQSSVQEQIQTDLLLPDDIERVSVSELPSYYSSNLGSFDNMTSVMNKLRDAMANFETTVTFTYTGNMSTFKTDFTAARDAMLIEQGNDYIYGTLKSTAYSYETKNNVTTVNVSFGYHGTTAQEEYVTSEIKRIAAELTTPGMTDFEKVLAVNDYIVTNTVYSTTASTTPHHAYALLKEGKAVCQAYALVTYRLLTEMGLEVRYVTGDAGEPHAWNSVKVDSVWYHLDTTWNDTIFNGLDLAGGVSYKYFLVTTDYLKQNHTWDEENYPVATDDRYSYYSDLMMGDINNGEIYYASTSNNYNLYKLNIKTGNKELLLAKPVYYVAAHNEYVYFSDMWNGKYLSSYNLITKEVKTIVEQPVTSLHIENGVLNYKIGSKSYAYELPLSAIEQATRDVELQILSLSEFSTLQDLEAAQVAYNALTSDQQQEVKSLTKLQSLKEIYPVNIAAANVVAEAVKNYSEQSTRAELLEIITQFDALKPSQQALVSNKDNVYSFKAIIATQNSEIKAVEDAIGKLKATSKTYLADIAKVREAYDALDAQLKIEVSNFATFESAEASVAAAQTAYNLIEKLDGSSIDAIIAARKAYTDTPKATQKYVTNLKALTTYETSVKTVIASINAINAIDPTSTKFVSQVATARKAYDKLGSQQNLVTNADKFIDIEKQSKVYDAIAKLKNTSAKYIAEVTAAKTAYDDLEKKELVSNLARLTTAIEAIKPAQLVVAKIAELDGKSAEALLSTRKAYDALDKTTKKYVTNAKNLTAIEKTLKPVVTAIKAIDAIDPTSSKYIAQVKTARKAFDKAATQKDLVTNAKAFETLESQALVLEQISKLKPTSAKYIAEVVAARNAHDALAETTLVTNVDKLTLAIEAIKPAQLVVAQINALDGKSVAPVVAARTAYDALDKTTKKYVTNLKALTAIEKTLKPVLTAINAINAIDAASTKFVAQVKTAQKAYDKLGTDKNLVTNASTLATIAPQASVYEQISKLKATSTKYIAEVTAAKAAYDALAVNSSVTNVDKLTTALAAIRPAQEVNTQIDKLTGNSLDVIEQARNAYDALDKATQKYVTNVKALTALEKKITPVLKVMTLIDEVSELDSTTKEFSSKAASMKKAYNALTDENKALVSTIETYNELILIYDQKFK